MQLRQKKGEIKWIKNLENKIPLKTSQCCRATKGLMWSPKGWMKTILVRFRVMQKANCIVGYVCILKSPQPVVKKKNRLGHKNRLIPSTPPQAGAIPQSMHNYTCWFPGLRWWMGWKWGWRESKVAIKSNQWAEKAQGSRGNGVINHIRHGCLIPYQHPE